MPIGITTPQAIEQRIEALLKRITELEDENDMLRGIISSQEHQIDALEQDLEGK